MHIDINQTTKLKGHTHNGQNLIQEQHRLMVLVTVLRIDI